ncbi:MAG: DUF4340 domain-containing protein [Candidatus Omnitrophica bacterium]|nr:DUF4340 domain-containing protein [Candidatus Omnitrophota bacterium]
MKFKKLLIIIGVFSFLLALVIIKSFCHKIQSVKASREEPSIALVNSNMNVSVSKIIIYNGSDEKNKVIISKNNEGQWVLESRFGLRARKEAVDNFLGNLNNTKGEVRAESKDVFNDFQIQDNESAHLILAGADGKPLTHLVISFKKPDGNQNFIREFNSEKILLTNRNILNSMGFFGKAAKCDENNFANYKIFNFDVNSVNKIEFTDSRKHSLVLTKTEATDKNPSAYWNSVPVNPKSLLDSAKVEKYLQSIAAFYSQDILDPALSVYGFEKPYAVLKLRLIKGGKTEEIRLEVGNYLKEKHCYYVKIMPQNQVFIVSDSLVNSLNHDKSYFSAKADKAKKK